MLPRVKARCGTGLQQKDVRPALLLQDREVEALPAHGALRDIEAAHVATVSGFLKIAYRRQRSAAWWALLGAARADLRRSACNLASVSAAVCCYWRRHDRANWKWPAVWRFVPSAGPFRQQGSPSRWGPSQGLPRGPARWEVHVYAGQTMAASWLTSARLLRRKKPAAAWHGVAHTGLLRPASGLKCTKQLPCALYI